MLLLAQGDTYTGEPLHMPWSPQLIYLPQVRAHCASSQDKQLVRNNPLFREVSAQLGYYFQEGGPQRRSIRVGIDVRAAARGLEILTPSIVQNKRVTTCIPCLHIVMAVSRSNLRSPGDLMNFSNLLMSLSFA